ncbi:MAG: glycosyltransferase [Alphaproteobacteria bacterium]|nr:glycosyltransferase [Alphaproteobacteria bacterium]
MNYHPTVSVLMPVYNTQETHLREAIDSILNQTFKDFELLILNDCSTDPNVEKVVLSYNDKRIKYSKNEQNMGISGSRNHLVSLATGKYLAVMDHDDISCPERLAKQVEYLEQHPEIGVVGSFARELLSGKELTLPIEDEDIKLALVFRSSIFHPASMIRKELFNIIGYENEYTPAEDYALWCRLIKHTCFHNLPEILFIYRNHRDNTSHKQKRRTAEVSQKIRIFTKRENPELYTAAFEKATVTTRINLFGFIPFLTYTRKNGRSKCKLFNFIPLWSGKTKIVV